MGCDDSGRVLDVILSGLCDKIDAGGESVSDCRVARRNSDDNDYKVQRGKRVYRSWTDLGGRNSLIESGVPR